MAEASAPYVPSNDELSDEVADILIDLDNSTPSAKEVLAVLQERKTTWSVPEHRVAKYVDEYNLRRGEFGPPTDDDDSVRSGASRGSASDGDRRGRFIVKGASYSIGKILSGKTKTAKQEHGITRLDRRKMHFKAPQKSRPRRGSSRNTGDSSSNNADFSSDHSSSDHIGDDLPAVGNSNATMEGDPSAAATQPPKPPKRPQRTFSDGDEEEGGGGGVESEGRETPGKTSSFASIDTDKVTAATSDDNEQMDEEDDDADIVEEADRRSKFMMKGGSHSIQKVLKGKAREKKGFSRFDRRNLMATKPSKKPAPVPASKKQAAPPAAKPKVEQEPPKPAVEEGVLDALGDSYSEDVDVDTDGEEFAAEVARRSKFIAKGGTHSIKKVLAGEARSSGKSGPSRVNRRNISRSGSNDEGNAGDDEKPSAKEGKEPDIAHRPPMRTISCDSTDSQIEEEASRRSRFMVKGASHSIRNLLAGKAKKEKRGSMLDRRKLHFKHEADAVHYTETAHPKPQEINEARLKAEAEAKERAAARKANRFGGAAPKRPQRNISVKESTDEPSSAHGEEDDDAALEAEADRRSAMFKGGSHSIRNLFSGKGLGKKSGGINRFNRRKMHFKKESEAVHYTEKSHPKPEEINRRHQEEAARLRQEEEAKRSGAPTAKKASSAPKMPPRRISTESVNDSKTDLGEETSKRGVYAEIQALHGPESENASADANVGDDDLGLDTDDDIVEEADRRSKFMMKGGSYSIQKVLKGEARAKKGVTRFDRRKMHFKHESEAIHCHDNDGQTAQESGSSPDAAEEANFADEEADQGIEVEYDDDDEDADIIEEANRRSKFMMKGGSHSIQKVLRGEARAKKGVTRFDRRKMHFKHEAEAIHSHDLDSSNQQNEQSEPPADEAVDAGAPEEDDVGLDTDDDIIEEADRRSKFMMKGGSYSIQKVLKGEARTKKEGVTRFDRRKMHFKHESEAIHCHDHDGQHDGSEKENSESNPASREAIADDSAQFDDDDDEDADIIEEADRRSNFMMKGGSHSIQKVLRGEARAKKGVTRFDRRKMHFKNEKDTSESQAEESEAFDNDSAPAAPSRTAPRMPSRAAPTMPSRAGARTAPKMPSRAAPKMPSRAAPKMPSRAAPKLPTRTAPKLPSAAAPKLPSRGAPQPPTRAAEEDNSAEFDDEDADIIEEADKRSKFMMKGGSHSIQKVLRGEARAKKGVTRFDRRKMHFKHESEAIHSHDHDAGRKDHGRAGGRKADDVKAKDDDSSEFDEEELALLAEAEADPRSNMMLKGASHSIRNIFSGKAKKKEKPVAAGMERRKSQLKSASAVGTGLVDESDSMAPGDDPSISNRDDDDKSVDRRSRFTLKGASNSIKNLIKRKSGKKDPPKTIDAEIERLHSQDQHDEKSAREASSGGVDDDLDDEDKEIEEEANRRSNFMAKGASYSITKVLSGSARKKKDGITRFDRRKMHFKKESDAVHYAEKPHPKPEEINKRHQQEAEGEIPASSLKPMAGATRSPPADASPEKVEIDDIDDMEDDEDADIIEEADRRSKFMSKGGSYSIQKVLKGEARAKKGVSRFDRRKMHFKKEQEAMDESSNRSHSSRSGTPSVPAREKPAVSNTMNAKMPSRRVSDGMEEERAEGDVDPSEEDADLLAQADERTQMMMKGGGHSIRNMFSGKKKEKLEGTGFKRRVSHLKKVPGPASTPTGSDKEDTTQTSTVDLTASPKDDLKDDLKDDVDDIPDDDDTESGDVDRRSRFTLKGASHSIKKVLAGKARTKKGISRFDRRNIQGKTPGGR